MVKVLPDNPWPWPSAQFTQSNKSFSFSLCKKASNHHGNNQSVRSSAPVVSRCFPGGYNVKPYLSRGRLAWWLLAFLCCVPSPCPWYSSDCTRPCNRQTSSTHWPTFCKPANHCWFLENQLGKLINLKMYSSWKVPVKEWSNMVSFTRWVARVVKP